MDLKRRAEKVSGGEPLPPSVLALTILDGETLDAGRVTAGTHVRICVRNGEFHRTHPEILSVPTQRIPDVNAIDILASAKKIGRQGDTDLWRTSSISNCNESGRNSIINQVEYLLCRKLGLADRLEANSVSFDASLIGLQVGEARYPNLQTSEILRMINIAIVIRKGKDLFPARTQSYSLSKWTTVNGYCEMWRSKDPTLAGVSYEDAVRGVCVDGLCISSTYDILRFCNDHRAVQIGEAA